MSVDASLVVDLANYALSVVIYPLICFIWVLASAFLMVTFASGPGAGFYFAATVFYFAMEFRFLVIRPIPLLFLTLFTLVANMLNTAMGLILFIAHYAQVFLVELEHGDGFNWTRMMENRAIIPTSSTICNDQGPLSTWSDSVLRTLGKPMQWLGLEDDADSKKTQNAAAAAAAPAAVAPASRAQPEPLAVQHPVQQQQHDDAHHPMAEIPFITDERHVRR